jgi:type 1 glutamine amidotransferase
MKKIRFFWLCLCIAALLDMGLTSAVAQNAGQRPARIRVLVVTGGHDFERDAFLRLFQENPEITFRLVAHPGAYPLLNAASAKDYDVLVLYDMYQGITEEAKQDFVARLKEGKGLVALHHAIGSCQKWPEYAKIIGARYYLEPTEVAGVQKARSVYQHDMKFTVHIADSDHPVTEGLKDFTLHDETYNLFDVAPDNHVLLTTDEPTSNKVIGWARTYEKSRVVYLQSGHDHFAYENPNYQTLLKQAIRWVANRP